MPTGLGDELCWFCAQHDASGVDLSGNGNNATIGSAVSTSAPPTDPNNTTDIAWTAADGGGSTRAVNMSSAMAAVRTASLATGKYSISFWMLPSSTNNRRTFGTYQTNTRLRAGRSSAGPIYAALSTDGTTFYANVSPSSTTTRMHHFVLTWDDNNEAKGYVDGVLVTTDSVSTYAAGNIGGAFDYPDGSRGGGYIDDVRAFDRILTQTEITHLATSRGIEGSPYTYSGLGDEKLWLCPSLDDSADDISGNGNHGTYNGGMTTVADVSEGGTRAYFFDDVDDYISNTSLSLSGLSKFSYSAWIYDDDATSELSSAFSYAKSGSYSDDIFIYIYNSQFRAQVNNGADGTGYTSQPSKSTWNHLAVVFDGTQSTNADRLKYYLNGSQVSLTYDYTVPSSTGSPATPKQIEIGRYAAATTNLFSGKQDDIRIFDRALTTSEITALASKRGYQSSTGIRRINFSGGFQQLTGGFSG